MKEMKDVWIFTIIICDQAVQKGPLKGAFVILLGLWSPKFGNPSVLLALGVSSWAPKAYSDWAWDKKELLVLGRVGILCPCESIQNCASRCTK